MKMPVPYRKRHDGFSLVEMAVVILIAGIMMGAGLSLLSVKQEAAKWGVTQKNQETVKQALINYLGKNKRLPCPSTVALLGVAGNPPCASYSGIVPYATLGLDRTAALDGWENFITYAAAKNPITTPPPSPYTTAWMYSYHATDNTPPNTTTDYLAFRVSTSTGGITVTDGTTTIADPGAATGAAVVLISYGKNGFGAVNIKGGTNNSASAGADEAINVALDSTGAAITVVKRGTTDSTAGGGAFDDIVMMLSANDLVDSLIANGMLQSNPQAALNQANNFVIGLIVASRDTTGWCAIDPSYKFDVPSTSGGDSPVFPSTVKAEGVVYARIMGSSSIRYCTSSGNAYTLTAGDGTQKIVTVDELKGIITQGAGGFYL